MFIWTIFLWTAWPVLYYFIRSALEQCHGDVYRSTFYHICWVHMHHTPYDVRDVVAKSTESTTRATRFECSVSFGSKTQANFDVIQLFLTIIFVEYFWFLFFLSIHMTPSTTNTLYLTFFLCFIVGLSETL